MESAAKTDSNAPIIVDVDLGNRSYQIYIGSGLLDQPHLLQQHVHGKRVLVVTNSTVAPLYLDKVVRREEQRESVEIEGRFDGDSGCVFKSLPPRLAIPQFLEEMRVL
ncbi:hypothetical protein SO802_007155 [Lithocarpus litseifolius]|uniref:3-dehydroquinate synthase n=1 Tax=Lithocarpus litseifolius TaxID=425828 RepID=A0AAW2DQF7_9ROSI